MKSSRLLMLAAPLLVGGATARGTLLLQTTALSGSVTLSGGVISGSNIPGNFTVFAPFAPTGSGSELLSFTADVGTAGSVSFGPFTFYDAALSNIQFTILSGSTNILSGTAATGSLDGPDGSLNLQADTTPDNNGVVFTSDIVNVNQLSNPDLNIQVLNDSGLSITDGALDDFTAEPGTGAFDATVPEPASIGLLSVGSLIALRRRKAR
jgi:hypothetical protein